MMKLQDHFHPPLSLRRHWHSFHNAWATYLSSDLNQRLPEGYFAEPNVQFGIEIDVATFDESASPETILSFNADSQTTTFQNWLPPAPVMTVPLTLVTDTIEVKIYSNEAGPILAGAIELVSPANKDRPSHREAFVSKCIAYLQQGIGLVLVDVVKGSSANLHEELLAKINAKPEAPLLSEIYTTAYRSIERDGQTCLDIWQEFLSIGQELPTMPLWLRGDICIPVALSQTYERTCKEQRIAINGR